MGLGFGEKGEGGGREVTHNGRTQKKDVQKFQNVPFFSFSI